MGNGFVEQYINFGKLQELYGRSEEFKNPQLRLQ
jgi:hypothetical protein